MVVFVWVTDENDLKNTIFIKVILNLLNSISLALLMRNFELQKFEVALPGKLKSSSDEISTDLETFW